MESLESPVFDNSKPIMKEVKYFSKDYDYEEHK